MHQKMTGWTFECPLIHFLSVLGINADDLTFHQAFGHTPYLAAIKYIGRLILLEAGSPSASRKPDLSIPRFTEYHRDYIADQSLIPLTEFWTSAMPVSLSSSFAAFLD